MTVIRRVSSGCRVCRSTEANATVPYKPEFNEHRSNYGYKRLVDAPELLELIPETKSFLPLRSILAALNAPGGELETIGCATGAHPGKSDPNLVIAGFDVYVIFRDANRVFSELAYEELANRLADAWAPTSGVAIEFNIEPLQDYFGADGAWALKIITVGASKENEGEAWTRAYMGAAQLQAIVLGSGTRDDPLSEQAPPSQ